MTADSFAGEVPADRLYDLETDMWVLRADDGSVTVGATSFGLWCCGEVIAFTAKPRGAEVEARRGLGTVESAKTVLSVRAPIALRALVGNDDAEERPAIINTDPYGAGWMARGETVDWERDRAYLVDAAAYCADRLRIDPRVALTVR